MAAELRWILLLLSVPLLLGIWWWGTRRSTQAPGDSALRESSAADSSRPDPAGDASVEPAPHESREWGVAPFEPLSIHTADFERVPVLDGPMLVHTEPVHTEPVHTELARTELALTELAPTETTSSSTTQSVPPSHGAAVGESGAVPGNPDVDAGVSRAADSAEQQRIVTLRISAPGENRWTGAALQTAFDLHGLAFGRYQVFHRKHTDGRSLFYAASLVEPGTFDLALMPAQEFRGLTLFAVLPGPAEPLLTVDELLSAARGIAEELSGVVQDAKGAPLSPQRAAAMRDDIARYQASLPTE